MSKNIDRNALFSEVERKAGDLRRTVDEAKRAQLTIPLLGLFISLGKLSTGENSRRAASPRLDNVLRELNERRSEVGADFGHVLSDEIRRVVHNYEDWLRRFEAILADPDPEYVDFEIEFQTDFLSLRDRAEYALGGLRLAEIELPIVESFEKGVTESDKRLDRIITEFCSRLFSKFPLYSVTSPDNFPERFWWRLRVWDVFRSTAGPAR